MGAIVFDVWGSRGGRSAPPSRFGCLTSCYSLAVEDRLYVFDGGRGLATLAQAVASDARFAEIRRIYVQITHAHLDHWEGLKDADWMWRKGNGLALTILGPREALDAITGGYAPPSYVPLEILALGTLARLELVELAPDSTVELGGARLTTVPLHHYSGMAPNRRYLDTLGYRLELPGGPIVVYLNDHEPIAETRAREDAVLAGANLALVDANYCDAAEHAFGHGSIESAAQIARRTSHGLVLASHHGAGSSDRQIDEAFARHRTGAPNLAIATEGESWDWSAGSRSFTRRA